MDKQDKHYTATIYVAAPGTPLALSGGTSAAGHAYYSVADGQVENSYGFAPAKHGQSSGPGKVYYEDVNDYKNPYYSRTIEITKAQYDKLQEFGKDPAKYKFDMEYSGASNSCIDFTWGGLNHAGLHRQSLLGIGDKSHEGALKPLDNVRDIKSIEAPFPKSELNKEQQNELPKRTPLQWLISEQQPTTPSSLGPREANVGHEDSLVSQAQAAVRRLDESMGRQYDTHSACMAASAACLAKSSGLSAIDHIVLSESNGLVRKGENMFVVQGALNDPAHDRAHMKTQDAVSAPVEQSLAKLQELNEVQQRQPIPAMEQPQRQMPPTMQMG